MIYKQLKLICLNIYHFNKYILNIFHWKEIFDLNDIFMFKYVKFKI